MRPRKKDEGADSDFPPEEWFAETDDYFYPVNSLFLFCKKICYIFTVKIKALNQLIFPVLPGIFCHAASTRWQATEVAEGEKGSQEIKV